MGSAELISWSDGQTKNAIIDFVARVTNRNSPDFVEVEDRVAVFDNDGTLWCEKPLPVQADFMLRKIAEMAEKNPELKANQPWKAVAAKDYAWLSQAITKHYRGDDSDLKQMERGLLESFANISIEEFNRAANLFLRNERNPALKRPYLQCSFEPMIELLRFLEDNQFTNYIASGGGRDFMRPITQEVYGVPPERVIGSSVALEYRDDGSIADIFHRADLEIFDDGPAKPVRIWSRVGRRPIFAAGNANGDIPMLRFCQHLERPSLCLLINHDDETREFSYQAGAEDALNRASQEHWLVVSVKDDWNIVFSGQTRESSRERQLNL